MRERDSARRIHASREDRPPPGGRRRILRRANASAATLEGCAREMAALFDEARRHIEALRANGWVGTKETAS